MVNEYCAQGCHFTLVNDRLSTTSSVAARRRDDGAYRAERRPKSTLLRLLTGYLTPDSGTRHLQASRWRPGPRGAVAPAGGHAAANGPAGRLDGGNGHCHGTLTVGRDGGSGGAGGDGRHRLRWPCRSRYPGLSGGERQRVAGPLSGAAGATARAGWLLDEPTSALDLYYQQHLLRLLKRLTAGGQLHGLRVVLHDLNLAALWADRILLLHQGHLVAQGTPQEVIQQPVIHRWYGADVRLVHPDNAVPSLSGAVTLRRNWNPDRAALTLSGNNCLHYIIEGHLYLKSIPMA